MKKKQKTHRKRAMHQGAKPKKTSGKISGTSSNWDQSVRAATGGEFTPGEIGQIAPLDQEGEGNRQNDEAEELEQIKPDR